MGELTAAVSQGVSALDVLSPRLRWDSADTGALHHLCQCVHKGNGQSVPSYGLQRLRDLDSHKKHPCPSSFHSAKPLRSFFSSHLKSLPDVRKKSLFLPEKSNKEEKSEVVVWKEFDRQV